MVGVVEPRGEGLVLGLELTGSAESTAVAEAACRAGVLPSTDGPRRNVLKLKPPPALGYDDAELLLRTLDAALYVVSRFSIR